MNINVSELIWTILCFFVLLFVLKKLLLEPILKVMDARRANVDEGLAAGREARQAKDENAAALQQAKRETAQQAGAILQQAKPPMRRREPRPSPPQSRRLRSP